VDAVIEELEQVAAAHWRAAEEGRLGEWLLRAGGGFTGRANSALATGDPGMPPDDAIAAVTAWYQARGLPPMIAVPMSLPERGGAPHHLQDLLTKRLWTTRQAPAYVMTADCAGRPGQLPQHTGAWPQGGLPPGTALRLDAVPDDAWLGMYHYRGQQLPPVARELLVSAPWQSFASIREASGDPLAIARLSVGGGWAGITAVEVAESQRRRGLGTLITRAVCAAAADRGVTRVFLQVETANTAAQALYERCGFRYSHWYQYWIAPAPGRALLPALQRSHDGDGM
jgi:ribosomal protein S18 acetylase RimI-like enzyme